MASDAELIEDILSGNREAFGVLVRKYQSATYALAVQRIGRAAAAEEIAQDVFVAAYRKLAQLRDRDRFGAWIRTITLRRCGMWARAERRAPHTLPLPTEHAAAQRADPHGEAAFGIDAMIRGLPPGLRAAAVLCFEDELSPSAAATVLGLKPGTLRKRLHDARVKLQRQIVEKAEQELRMHLLPRDFAERCVCRCERAQGADPREEVIAVTEKKDCRCGCREDAGRRAKPATKRKPKPKRKTGK